MRKIKFFTVSELLAAGELASQRGYNRQLDNAVTKNLIQMSLNDTEVKFPVLLSMSHEHAQGVPVDPHVRVMVALSPDNTIMLDVDTDLFTHLGEINEKEKAK